MSPQLENIITQLKAKSALPKKIEVSSVSSYCFANMFDEAPTRIISESVSCGFDMNPDLAILKGLSEFFENRAFKEGFEKGIESCSTDRSDGFAAFPVSETVNYKVEARKNAFQEAIERLVWANWWDDSDVGFNLLSIDDICLNHSQMKFVKNVKTQYGLEKILAVYPHFESVGKESLIVLIGFFKDGGVVSGGACSDDSGSAVDRALSELFRHTLAITRMRTGPTSASSFYEKRLEYFSSIAGQRMVESRMTQVGFKRIKLPTAKFDIEVPHSLSDLFYVHRFLFDDQPEFIGGKLERFCI